MKQPTVLAAGAGYYLKRKRLAQNRRVLELLITRRFLPRMKE
ncbi:hypothetical protein protein [Bacillus cereus G9241]|nr:hypothetical protein protein [Bacillus cereus G9241]